MRHDDGVDFRNLSNTSLFIQTQEIHLRIFKHRQGEFQGFHRMLVNTHRDHQRVGGHPTKMRCAAKKWTGIEQRLCRPEMLTKGCAKMLDRLQNIPSRLLAATTEVRGGA